MNKKELKNRFIKEKISSSIYSLEGGLPNEKLCLDDENGSWVVYYSERGIKTGIRYFSTECEACNYLYNKVIKITTGDVK